MFHNYRKIIELSKLQISLKILTFILKAVFKKFWWKKNCIRRLIGGYNIVLRSMKLLCKSLINKKARWSVFLAFLTQIVGDWLKWNKKNCFFRFKGSWTIVILVLNRTRKVVFNVVALFIAEKKNTPGVFKACTVYFWMGYFVFYKIIFK